MMTDGVAIPLHLAVHVLGLTVTVGLAGHALLRRRDAGATWPGLVVGGGLLAVTHVALGALMTDGATWPLYLRTAAYAGVAVGAAGRMVGGPAAVVIAPIGAHIAAAAAGVAAALATWRGVLGRGRQVLPLVGGLVLWAASDLVTRDWHTAGSLLSVAGSLSVAVWLYRRTHASFLARSVGTSAAVLLALVVGLASASGAIFSADLERDELSALATLADARATQYGDDWPQELRSIAAVLGGSRVAGSLASVASGEIESLDPMARVIASFPGIDVAVLLDDDGRVVGSYSPVTDGALPAVDAATVAGDTIVATTLSGRAASGVVAIADGQLLAVGAVPVEDDARQVDPQTGALLVGRLISDARTVAEIRSRTGAEATILAGDEVVASSLGAEASDEVADAVAAGTSRGLVEVRDQRWLLAGAPIVDDRGTTVGRVVLTQDASVLASLTDNATRTLFWLALAGLVLAGGLTGLFAHYTTRPVRRLTAAAERVAAGDLDTRMDLQREDEVGRLAGAFDHMVGALSTREEALRQAATVEAALRQRLETVTGSMGEGLVAVDVDGRITTVNAAGAALVGGDAEELRGRDVARVLNGVAGNGEPLMAALGGPDTLRTAAVRGVLGKGRRGVHVAATAAPLRDADDRTIGRVYVLRDVSGEAEVERMKTEFLSNISHELRTPLTPIKGYAEVMRSKDVGPERTTEFAENIVQAAGRLERIIGMLVDFASLEAGRMEVAIEPTDLSDVVSETLASWRRIQPDRRFVRRLARDLPEVQVDPKLLRRVLEELIDNAVKFSEDTVSILGAHGEDGTVRVTIRDRGAGISPDELDRILRDFHQVDGSATRRYGGLGLGLSIVQRILERFDAELVVESSEHEGTDVTVVLQAVDG